jgi:hypothetical protein
MVGRFEISYRLSSSPFGITPYSLGCERPSSARAEAILASQAPLIRPLSGVLVSVAEVASSAERRLRLNTTTRQTSATSNKAALPAAMAAICHDSNAKLPSVSTEASVDSLSI